jgi:hypothetical protein
LYTIKHGVHDDKSYSKIWNTHVDHFNACWQDIKDDLKFGMVWNPFDVSKSRAIEVHFADRFHELMAFLVRGAAAHSKTRGRTSPVDSMFSTIESRDANAVGLETNYGEAITPLPIPKRARMFFGATPLIRQEESDSEEHESSSSIDLPHSDTDCTEYTDDVATTSPAPNKAYKLLYFGAIPVTKNAERTEAQQGASPILPERTSPSTLAKSAGISVVSAPVRK